MNKDETLFKVIKTSIEQSLNSIILVSKQFNVRKIIFF